MMFVHLFIMNIVHESECSILTGYLFWLKLDYALFGHHFSTFKLHVLCLAEDQ